MSSLKTERPVYLVSAKINMHPHDAPPVLFKKALDIILGYHAEKRAFARLNDSDGINDETVALTPEEAEKRTPTLPM
jgi:hypothetical protein